MVLVLGPETELVDQVHRIKARQDHESSLICFSNLFFFRVKLKSGTWSVPVPVPVPGAGPVPGPGRVTSGPVSTGFRLCLNPFPGAGLRSSPATMPMSRPGSESADFWVDGSRRDGPVEEFYTLSSELGRFVPSERNRNVISTVDHSLGPEAAALMSSSGCSSVLG